jgi:hypothetical protein
VRERRAEGRRGRRHLSRLQGVLEVVALFSLRGGCEFALFGDWFWSGESGHIELPLLEGGTVVLLPPHPIVLPRVAEESPVDRDRETERGHEGYGQEQEEGRDRRVLARSSPPGGVTSRSLKMRFWSLLSSSRGGKGAGSTATLDPFLEMETTVAGAGVGGVLQSHQSEGERRGGGGVGAGHLMRWWSRMSS